MTTNNSVNTSLSGQMGTGNFMGSSLTVQPSCSGRLTLTTGTPVTTSDVTAATTIYFTPFRGSFIDLFDGSSVWNRLSFSEISIAVPATTLTMYDVFCFNSSGTATLELLAWTNPTTRATALTTQNGVYVKTGATTRRYLGSFSTTGVSGQTEDSKANRLLFNYYNRVLRSLANATETANSWAYSSSTLRQANGNTANCLNVNIGVSEDTITARVFAMAQGSSTSTQPAVAIGIDSTTVNSAQIAINNAQEVSATGFSNTSAEWVGYPGVGNHQINWLESNISNANTVTWFGDNNNPPITQSGMVGTFMM